MSKQQSIITIARQGDHYTVEARGAFGGGWTAPTEEKDLASTILRGWQMYGSNPKGCQIVAADVPADVAALIKRLESAGTGEEKAVLTVRLSQAEAELCKSHAEAAGQSLNQWARAKLLS